MKTLSISIPSFFFLLIIFSCSSPASADDHDDFLECLSEEFRNYSSISSSVFTAANSSFTSILRSPIKNLRFTSESTPRPQVIITPQHETQIPALIYCAKESDLEIRTRSGGHDFEGLSSVSRVPFVIIDLINLNETTVDVEAKTAWIQGGATIGSVYYRIAEKSRTLGFPGGSYPTIGVGGLISGGGYGPMFRKHGTAADHVIDARIVDVNGRILDRKSMGEDLFWAIRGGGGASFGVIVAWKVQLVDVPERVAVFSLFRSSEQNATQLIHRWQYVAPQLDRDLFIGASISRGNNMSIVATFTSLFLGTVDRLLPLMQERFPELGLVREDCTEMSWIESIIYFATAPVPPVEPLPLEFLLNRTQPNIGNAKIKSDYAKKPIPEYGIQGIERLLQEPEAAQSFVFLVPYGGRMAEISKSATPFPHRAGYLFKIGVQAIWPANEAQNSSRYINWSRRYYRYMTPYVSSFPRGAYLNYRDLDIGANNPHGKTSYAQASIWGRKYFDKNFDRLVRVKTVVDPDNFFKNEQSIPPLTRWH